MLQPLCGNSSLRRPSEVPGRRQTVTCPTVRHVRGAHGRQKNTDKPDKIDTCFLNHRFPTPCSLFSLTRHGLPRTNTTTSQSDTPNVDGLNFSISDSDGSIDRSSRHLEALRTHHKGLGYHCDQSPPKISSQHKASNFGDGCIKHALLLFSTAHSCSSKHPTRIIITRDSTDRERENHSDIIRKPQPYSDSNSVAFGQDNPALATQHGRCTLQLWFPLPRIITRETFLTWGGSNGTSAVVRVDSLDTQK